MRPNIKATVVEKSKSAFSKDMVCFYCKKPGRKISDCLALKKKERLSKPVGLVFTSPFINDTLEERESPLSHYCGKPAVW